MLRSVLAAVPGEPRKEVDADREHWAQERAYWTERMRPWYREKYSLAPDPIQKDVSRVPPADMVAAIHFSERSMKLNFLKKKINIIDC